MKKISIFYPIKELQNIGFWVCLLLLMDVSCVSTVNAYQLTGVKWPQPSTTFYVDIPGGAGLWNDAFEGAMYEWNAATVFQFQIVPEYSDPCDSNDNKNGVKFASTDCGDAWGSTTLAICHWWFTPSTSTITQADIVFNSNESWDVYSTPWQYSVNDFKRVAVHELGHAIGLGHEDSGPLTIMGTYVGDITDPQQDDINGVAAMYGSACTYSISPSSGDFTVGSGTSSVSVTASSSSCAWTASESLDWVSLSPSGGTGPGAVTVNVTANTGVARFGSILIAGQTYIISQAALVTTRVTDIARLYVATFNRAPLQAGLDYWAYRSGLAIENIAKSFFDQPETKALYPAGTSNTDFVTAIYQNLFNRNPLPAGLDYWIGPDGLGGSITRDVMILAVINGAFGTDAEKMANKTEVGLYYAASGLPSRDFSLAFVTDDDATVAAAKAAIDAAK